MPALIDIEKRHARRCQIVKDSRSLKPPLIYDTESVKEHTKIVKDAQSELLDECCFVDDDVQVLLVSLREACSLAKVDVERVVEKAWLAHKMDDEKQAILNKRRNAEAEARAKEEKDRGEVPGQVKLNFNPEKMESAEAASEVTVRKLEPGE